MVGRTTCNADPMLVQSASIIFGMLFRMSEKSGESEPQRQHSSSFSQPEGLVTPGPKEGHKLGFKQDDRQYNQQVLFSAGLIGQLHIFCLQLAMQLFCICGGLELG